MELEKTFPGATILPILISSDKTRVVMFGTKSAYPVYMTIGNIPKELRRKPSQRTHILLGYLPTTPLHHVQNKASRRRMVANLFHYCVSRMLGPLKPAGEAGVLMSSGDGVTRRTFPILACFVGDYPEQVLVSGCKTGDCPKCPTKRGELGQLEDGYKYRDLAKVLEALSTFEDDPGGYASVCADAGIKPIVHPFWETLPYSDIYLAITPDILHQLYQGVMKHLISWVTSVFGQNEIDTRSKCLPPNHNVRSFLKGISSFSRLTGKEHADMCRILLGLVVDLKLPDGRSPLPLIRSIRSLLDFLYLAQYPLHTSETLHLLQQSLERFHEHKQIFVDLGIRDDFNLPKLHSLAHYVESIQLFGTTDNYNTEYTERLHIDLAKDAYRATNHRDEYGQMTVWLQRKEKVLQHQSYLDWRFGTQSSIAPQPMPMFNGMPTLTKGPSAKAVDLDNLVKNYGATFFREALRRHIVLSQHTGPPLTRHQLEQQILYINLPFTSLPVYHKLKFVVATNSDKAKAITLDAIHVRPERKSKRETLIPARFDTALLNVESGRETGLQGVSPTSIMCRETDSHQGYRVGQVRVIFTLPGNADEHLAYVEWFSKFSAPDPDHGMLRLNRTLEGEGRVASVVSVSSIRRSVHLFPKFGPKVPEHWTSANVLEKCTTFYLNPFSDRHMYYII